ncbi:MAG: AraC family transcriptional regulator [Eubacteriales bacterium]|nr:AraC family transcriptional regulator [Eubacteriales bacterium]
MNHIRYIEYNACHTADFVFHVPQGHDCWLLLLTHTPALFGTPGHTEEYPAGSAVLFPPHTPIYYRACGPRYENDWCRFDSDEKAVCSFPLTGVPFALPDAEYCHNLFQLLTWKNSFPGKNNEWIEDQLFTLLLTELHEAAQKYIPHKLPPSRSQELLSLRKEIYNNPQLPWSVSRMAQRLHVSGSHLQWIYRDAFGLSCMDDCIRARIRLAKDQLLYTEKTVSAIAEFCGYRNVEHFCRQFKQNTGQSPGSFRRLARTPVSST